MSRILFAEHMSTYAQSGDETTPERKQGRPRGDDVGLSPEELEWVDARRAEVPSFDALFKETLRG